MWAAACCGGEAGENIRTVSVYNERTDSWEAMGDMPTARRLALVHVAILNGKMMVVGGVAEDMVRGKVANSETDVVEIFSHWGSLLLAPH